MSSNPSNTQIPKAGRFRRFNRRRFLEASAFAAAGILQARASSENSSLEQAWDPEWRGDWTSSTDLRPLAQFPGKVPLILLTDRPPQLETPLHYFREDLTPNDAYFVRWHLSGIPTAVNTADWRLRISGVVDTPLELSLDDLRHKFEPVSLVALNQCSGNSRGLFEPRVPGGQWRNGAMGNSRWTGVRLKDLLDHAGVKGNAVEASFRGLDKAPLPATPVFEKSLPIDLARNGDVMVAYEMNGKPLPMLNGFPVRLVVPGWYATYWVKSLSFITVRDTPLRNYWMEKAYRIPNNPDALEQPGHLAQDTVPINRLSVHCIFVSPEPGETVAARTAREVQGVAMDYGAGIRRVEFSSDNGRSWSDAALDPDLGRYSWRRWRVRWTPPGTGVHTLKVRATNHDGRQQLETQWNHSGYQRAVVEHMNVSAV